MESYRNDRNKQGVTAETCDAAEAVLCLKLTQETAVFQNISCSYFWLKCHSAEDSSFGGRQRTLP